MSERTLSDHPCECGCGQMTYIATRTLTRCGHVKGQPYRYAPGHNRRTGPRPESPNPSGLCLCGCGASAPLAQQTSAKLGYVEGEPVKYILGHNAKPPPPKTDANGCWVWQGAPGSHGRGQMYVDGAPELAYRAFYREHIGEIPAGYHLHHTCENPMCVNPEHLEPLTPKEHRARHPRRKD